MKRKVLDYKIPYREKGKLKYYPVAIETVFNYVYQENEKMVEVIDKVKAAANRIEKIAEEAKLFKSEDEYEKLNAELEVNRDYILENKDFFKKQFDLINSVLEDNGIVDQEVNTIEFWNRKVEPLDMREFIVAIVKKDTTSGGNGQKKKRIS